jgi:hypothetical protein
MASMTRQLLHDLEPGLPPSSLLGALLCASVLCACQPFKGDLGGLDAGSEPGSASGTGDSSIGSGGATATATDGVDPQCEVDPKVYFPDLYGGGPQLLDATCVLESAEDDSSLIGLVCAGEEVSLSFLTQNGPLVNWQLFVGTSLEVHTRDVGKPDITGRYVRYVSIRSETRLLYASVLGETLDFSPGVSYAPLELAAPFGLCPLVSTIEDTGNPGGDSFGCDAASRMQLSVAVAGDPGEPLLLEGGQAAEVPVEGGHYAVDVDTMLRGENCWTDPISPQLDVYAFAIAWQPD